MTSRLEITIGSYLHVLVISTGRIIQGLTSLTDVLITGREGICAE